MARVASSMVAVVSSMVGVVHSMVGVVPKPCPENRTSVLFFELLGEGSRGGYSFGTFDYFDSCPPFFRLCQAGVHHEPRSHSRASHHVWCTNYPVDVPTPTRGEGATCGDRIRTRLPS